MFRIWLRSEKTATLQKMIHSTGRQLDRERGGILLLVLPLLLAGLSSCGQSRNSEVSEALRLAGILQRFAPEAAQLLEREHATANDLKIILDESLPEPVIEKGQSLVTEENAKTAEVAKKMLIAGTPEFRRRVNADLDALNEIRARRSDIQQTIKQGTWRSPMVAAVQRDAVSMFEDEINQDDNWILYVRNIQARAALGRKDIAPEYGVLIRELGGFVRQVSEVPLSVQKRNLIEEFRFSENDIRP